MSEALHHNHSLKVLDLARNARIATQEQPDSQAKITDNKITDEGAKYVAEMIKVNNTLMYIELQCRLMSELFCFWFDEFLIF